MSLLKINIKFKSSKMYQHLLNEYLIIAGKQLLKSNQFRGKSFQKLLPTLMQNLKMQLQNGIYQPQKPEFFHSGNEEDKLFARYNLTDNILINALYCLLSDALSGKFLPQCIGRRGYSRHDFLKFLKKAWKRKHYYVLVADVANYFYSIDHSLLDRFLKQSPFRLPKDVRRLILALLNASGKEKGVIPGNAMAKFLGNVFLHPVDEFLAKKEVLFCRYIDDFAIFLRTKKQALKICAELREFLNEKLNLRLSERKTGIFHIYGHGFEFLGFKVIGGNVKPTVANIERFNYSISDWLKRAQRKKIKKAVRGFNQRIYWFGHQYKMCSVKRVYEKLDKRIRAGFRKYLKNCQGIVFRNNRFNNPSMFPDNLAFTNSEIYSLGLASLVKIKEAYDLKRVSRKKPSLKNKEKVNILEIVNGKNERIIKVILN